MKEGLREKIQETPMAGRKNKKAHIRQLDSSQVEVTTCAEEGSQCSLAITTYLENQIVIESIIIRIVNRLNYK